MSSNSSGKCPLCFTTILVKNFKRHCDARHNSVDTKEKYEKLLKKLKETINNQRQQLSTPNLTTPNEPLTPTSNETSPDIIQQEITQTLADNEYTSSFDVVLDENTSSSDEVLDENTSSDSSQDIIQMKSNICGHIRFILKQTQLVSQVIDMAFDETISTKNFLIETASSFGKIKESVNDLLVLCDTALEKMPSISVTVDKLRSSETIISRDPSTTKVYNEVELRYLVDQGPYQPLLARYPINEKFKKSNDTCYFVPRWYNEFPLIEYSPITDSIYCFCCRLFAFGPGCAQAESAWISSGVKTWNKIKGGQGAGKKGKIDVHIQSDTHQSSLQRYLNFKDRKNNVDYMLDKNLQQQEQQKIEQNKSNEEVINILIDCARYLSRQGLAFRGHEEEEGNFHQLIYLLSRHNSLLNDWIKNNNNRFIKIVLIKYMMKK